MARLTKRCFKCKEVKVESSFYKNKSNKTGLSSWCKKCTLQTSKKQCKKNPDIKRAWNLLSKYGVTLEQYDRLFEEQKGVCAICGQSETKKSPNGWVYRLSVDHNHKTKKIRGLLCKRCNVVIGAMKYPN